MLNPLCWILQRYVTDYLNYNLAFILGVLVSFYPIHSHAVYAKDDAVIHFRFECIHYCLYFTCCVGHKGQSFLFALWMYEIVFFINTTWIVEIPNLPYFQEKKISSVGVTFRPYQVVFKWNLYWFVSIVLSAKLLISKQIQIPPENWLT